MIQKCFGNAAELEALYVTSKKWVLIKEENLQEAIVSHIRKNGLTMC